MTYMLMGLDCAHCAAKLEGEIRKIAGLSHININFVTKTIDIPRQYEEDVRKVINQIEPDVKLVAKGKVTGKGANMDENKNELKSKMASIIASSALLLVGLLLAPKLHGRYELIEYAIFLAAYFICGHEVILTAIKNITSGEIFDENFLMTIATIGAFAIHELPEAVGVMLFYSVGEYLQSLAVNRSRRSIETLMEIRPDYANLKAEGSVKIVSPDDVQIGDIIIVKPGEKVPLDGKVIKGDSFTDTSALTGESVPRKMEPGKKILSGMVNIDGLLEVEVEKNFGESSVSKILDLVQNAGARKAKTEQFITRFARYYTPAVVFTSAAVAIIPPLIIGGASFSKWLYRALTMLVISCPCALVVSIPLGYFGGIGGASKKGILIKGANFLEALTHLQTVVFDKTGTLTKGVFKVTQIKPANGFSEDEVLKWAAFAEVSSNHPIARSILDAYGKEIETVAYDYREISGHGVQATAKGLKILAGNEKLMQQQGIEFTKLHIPETVVYVAINGVYAGCIIISDEIKPDAKKAIKDIKQQGVRYTVMLTGDNPGVAKRVSEQIGIDSFYAKLLPEDKVKILEQLKSNTQNKGKVAFVGDGINDAPVIAQADIGIAMGGLGSDAAIEAADIVIMEDAPSKLGEAIRIARYTRKIIVQNIIFALGVKIIFLPLGAAGIVTMWGAVFADVGVALIAILNSTRTLLHK